MSAAESDAREVVGMSHYDAWFLARACAGHALDPEDRRISAPIRPLARRMAEVPDGGRKRVWDDHLTQLPRSEADARVEAVAAADPEGPPPEDDGWGQPLAFELPPVEGFAHKHPSRRPLCSQPDEFVVKSSNPGECFDRIGGPSCRMNPFYGAAPPCARPASASGR
jgi:hypothetical protein